MEQKTEIQREVDTIREYVQAAADQLNWGKHANFASVAMYLQRISIRLDQIDDYEQQRQ